MLDKPFNVGVAFVVPLISLKHRLNAKHETTFLGCLIFANISKSKGSTAHGQNVEGWHFFVLVEPQLVEAHEG